ncbi:4-(cytidine 5'-diphospho)-2-C-methyl-D-erythritol kinase [endosymbiont of unidentified scaly snail isolate Monju]|uniref:4-(cytidine 5'-diphospho)-2-C-methyl-D-erythritol kinase n=1 Tax=endosymbiont of unidentified scaly snail isolate Monju TaxID=1248727 RepID=UPI0003891C31|nr:4-(cytidine 5'-diphospho)-2-C-methyl-D-erythritol kinase [endosymbiont of unidentified scaly snail isolate Monju]BAN68148.1 4-diphosphocytidyl-2-C-methyl-D-erythritol kinase [endosymbiont of unidentified scaly snail isolate Monju]
MSDWSRGWPAPAKLNLMLRITGRRADGYHELQTVFQFLDLCDELDFRVRKDGKVRRLDPLPGVAPEADLTVRAARLLRNYAGVAPGVDIALRKRLPMGGGLGGGSSNAATVLHALNHLWGCGLDDAELAVLGLRLGADVPIFVHGHAAWAEGVGERLRPIALPEPWYLVIAPDCHVATGEVFSAPELTRNSRPIIIRAFIAGDRRNDCLPVVRERYPAVSQVIEWLEERAEARLTGTGGCVFAEFASASAAEQVRQQVPADWQAWVARGCNRSPLRGRLEHD